MELAVAGRFVCAGGLGFFSTSIHEGVLCWHLLYKIVTGKLMPQQTYVIYPLEGRIPLQPNSI